MEKDLSLFSLLLLSFGNAALVAMGIMEDPDSKKTKKEMNVAQYNIEVIEMLHSKTKGNLNPEENILLDSLLYDLRLKYIEAAK